MDNNFVDWGKSLDSNFVDLKVEGLQKGMTPGDDVVKATNSVGDFVNWEKGRAEAMAAALAQVHADAERMQIKPGNPLHGAKAQGIGTVKKEEAKESEKKSMTKGKDTFSAVTAVKDASREAFKNVNMKPRVVKDKKAHQKQTFRNNKYKNRFDD